MYFTLKYFRMKFWKQILVSSILFSAIAVTFFYSACEKDTCNNVTCYNGGACGNGKCSCPTGYENSQCQTKSVARFVGVFAGYTSCSVDNGPSGAEVIDSAFIYADTSSPQVVDYVWVVLNSIKPTVLHGYVQANASTYSIVVPSDTSSNYSKSYTITLQSNSNGPTLNIGSWEYDYTNPLDTVINKCTFVGLDTASH